tara:strand:+ start:61047 stop:61964 length:918 start_codon:yes stop_codon:yes gene_type:complete
MSNIEKLSEGVIYPIPPAFSERELSSASIKGYLNYLHREGAKTILTTAGTTRFNLLDEFELQEMNELCSEFQGSFIMGLPPLANKHLSRELEFANAIKPDAILLFYPDRYYDDESVVNYFYWAADRSEVPVMIHGMFMRHALGGMYDYTPQIVEKLKKHPNIIGMKEESSKLALAYDVSRLADDDFLIFPAGGSCRRFLLTGPAGAQTFLGGIGNIFPEIEDRFLEEFTAGDLAVAHDIVTKFEEPLFNVFKKIGWHKALQSALNYKQLLPTENRAPFSEVTREQQLRVRGVVDDIERRWDSYVG